MITSTVLNFFISISISFANLIPDLTFTIDESIINSITSIISTVCYFFPITALMPLFTFELAFLIFKFVWKIVLRVKSFVPTMGD